MCSLNSEHAIPPRSPRSTLALRGCDQTGAPLTPVPGYCSSMNDYHTQYLTYRGNNILSLTLVNIDIEDDQECLSDQETDLEEEINKSIAGAAGNETWEIVFF